VNTVDLETLKVMRKAGCDAISFGLETGNQEMLDRLQKRATLDMARRATQMVKEAGLICHASFIVGLPGETQQTMQDTEDFASKLDIQYGYHILTPFPGTTVREEVRNYDLTILTEDWAKYDANQAVVRTSALSPRDIEAFVEENNRKTDILWQDMVRDYHAGKASPNDALRVLGSYRMAISFRLLSEDLVERFGEFSNGDFSRASEPPETALAKRIYAFTGQDPEMTTSMIREYKNRGLIDYRQTGRGLTWFWTHNRNHTFGPFSLTEAQLGV
jgi:anaerobic magnesium-protoporphyrin IX monomethyl ester cyclase